MVWFWAALALLGGVALAVQTGVNAQLRLGLGHPTLAALANTLIAAAILLLCIAVIRPELPRGATLANPPWWHWTGGVLGAGYLLAAIVAAPRLGAASLLALIVAGQMLGAILLDHFGLIGFPERAISPPRLLGVTLLVAGVVLIRRY